MVSLAVAVVGLLAIANAWRRQLIPWAAEWGNWAEWVAAAGTVLGFAAAVFTLSKNARDQRNQREEDVLAEASRVAMTVAEPNVDFTDSLAGYVRYSYRGMVHNAASSPVREVQVELDGTKTKVTGGKGLNFLHHEWNLGTIPAGVQGNFLVEVSVSGVEVPDRNDLVQSMLLLFTDVHGHTWNQTANESGKAIISRVREDS